VLRKKSLGVCPSRGLTHQIWKSTRFWAIRGGIPILLVASKKDKKTLNENLRDAEDRQFRVDPTDL